MASPSKETKLRVMIDTNVLMAGIVWRRFPREVLQHALDHDIVLILCELVIKEARRNFRTNPVFQPYQYELENYLALVDYQLIPTPPDEEIQTNLHLSRDVDDVPIALAAIQHDVILVSSDKDLSDPEASPILHEAIDVYIPGTFLREVMGWSSEDLDIVSKR